jgi:outer membrane lipoprotein carrier protein
MEAAKSWRPRHRPTTDRLSATGRFTIRLTISAFVLLTLAVVLAAPVFSQQSGRPAGGEAALDRFLDSVDSFSARFDQALYSPDNQLLETAAGELLLKRPNRFRWHYELPYEQLLIADGTNLWMYDVELAQVTAAALDETGGPSPALLLSGDASVRENFVVTADFVHDDMVWVKLEPATGGADFTAVLAGFRDGQLSVIELVDSLEQLTRIEFRDVEINPDLPESRFMFEPPPGVDVLGVAR